MKIVRVRWYDATTFGHWATREVVEGTGLKECYAEGGLFRETPELVTVVLLRDAEDEAYSNWVNIPRMSVISMEVIENGGGENKPLDD
jgi:hypothetical protein